MKDELPNNLVSRESLRRLRFFELSSDLLAVVSFEGRFEDMNPSWTRTLGYERPALLGRDLLLTIASELENIGKKSESGRHTRILKIVFWRLTAITAGWHGQ